MAEATATISGVVDCSCCEDCCCDEYEGGCYQRWTNSWNCYSQSWGGWQAGVIACMPHEEADTELTRSSSGSSGCDYHIDVYTGQCCDEGIDCTEYSAEPAPLSGAPSGEALECNCPEPDCARCSPCCYDKNGEFNVQKPGVSPAGETPTDLVIAAAAAMNAMSSSVTIPYTWDGTTPFFEAILPGGTFSIGADSYRVAIHAKKTCGTGTWYAAGILQIFAGPPGEEVWGEVYPLWSIGGTDEFCCSYEQSPTSGNADYNRSGGGSMAIYPRNCCASGEDSCIESAYDCITGECEDEPA